MSEIGTKRFNSMNDVREEFIKRDCIKGTKVFNVLNKREIPPRELDQIFNSWVYESE